MSGEVDPRTAPLDIRVENGKLLISIGVTALARAVEQGPYAELDGGAIKVLDHSGFAVDIAGALCEATHTGPDLLQDALDEAALKVLEDASEHVGVPPSPDTDNRCCSCGHRPVS